MSNLSAKVTVACPLSQADRYVRRYFRERGSDDGSVARLKLTADVSLLKNGPSLAFERPAIATITPRLAPGDMLESYAVTWASDGGGPYPTFVGSLRIGAMDDYESFELILDGRYEPPLGVLGDQFDAVLGHRVAQSTALHFLHGIERAIEASFQSEEKKKPYRQAR
jgi:hypothetical protein